MLCAPPDLGFRYFINPSLCRHHMHIFPLPLDLSGATPQQIRAIKNKAFSEGVSFEEAAKRMLLELEDRLEKGVAMTPIARLFRFSWMH